MEKHSSPKKAPKLMLEDIDYKITKLSSVIWITHNRTGEKSLRAKIDIYSKEMKLLGKDEIEIESYETGLLTNKERMRMGEKLKKQYMEFKKDIGAI
ncbi:hypothetical protein OAB94_01715 [Flavobacteriaceae bacterium]|nr:hypothetical protein [Flavobacteriaceae bacterium]